MKRLAFTAVLAIILVAPAAAAAKDAGMPVTPAAKKVESKKEAPASQPASRPTKDAGIDSQPVSGEVKLTPPGDAFNLWKAFYDIYTDFKNGKVWDGISVLLMVLTFVFFKIREDLPVKYAVWIAAGLGIATNIVSAIVGGVGWGPAITAGLFQGAAAGGFWTMVGKHIFRSHEDRAKRAKAREMAENGKMVSGEIEIGAEPIPESKPNGNEGGTE